MAHSTKVLLLVAIVAAVIFGVYKMGGTGVPAITGEPTDSSASAPAAPQLDTAKVGALMQKIRPTRRTPTRSRSSPTSTSRPATTTPALQGSRRSWRSTPRTTPRWSPSARRSSTRRPGGRPEVLGQGRRRRPEERRGALRPRLPLPERRAGHGQGEKSGTTSSPSTPSRSWPRPSRPTSRASPSRTSLEQVT